MAEPVKTTLLKAIETAVKGVSDIKKVVRNSAEAQIERETAVWPVAFIFDDKETVKRRNRVDERTFALWIEIHVQSGTVSIDDQCDDLKAKTYKALLSNTAVLQACNRIEEISSEKFLTGDDTGAISIEYSLVYFHEYGDPYNAGR